jgi:hypothetical protein
MPCEVPVIPETVVTAHQQRICLSIGNVALGLNHQLTNQDILGRELDLFRVADADPDIDVDISWAPVLKPWRGEAVFDSGAVWTVFDDGNEFVFDFTSSALGRDPYKRMRVDRGFTSAQLILNRELLPDDVCPLEYPADELLITNHLAVHGLGVEVHGCGLIDAQAGGQLFLGHSGAGKSTTTRVWETFRDVQILSDDRIILRLHDGELWMYGTPWHGEAAFAAPGKAKLNRIFVLQHGRCNEMRALARAQAVGEIFARSFPPFHSAPGLERTLEFINRVLEIVPAYEFQFVPDQSSVKAVLEFND